MNNFNWSEKVGRGIEKAFAGIYNKLRSIRFPVAINYFLNEMRDLWQIHVNERKIHSMFDYCFYFLF